MYMAAGENAVDGQVAEDLFRREISFAATGGA